jgi:hypothetical protein
MKHDANTIINNCKPFITKSRNELLYKGCNLNRLSSDPYTISPGYYPNRKSKSGMSKATKTVIDTYTTELYGFPFRDGICCTGNYTIANTFFTPGMVCAVFPIGDFRYLWSPAVPDWGEFFGSNSIFSYDITDLITYLPTLTNTNLYTGILSGNEILIYCEKIYTIPIYYNDCYNPLLADITTDYET